jgi:hypothetical protein
MTFAIAFDAVPVLFLGALMIIWAQLRRRPGARRKDPGSAARSATVAPLTATRSSSAATSPETNAHPRLNRSQ